MKMFTNKDSVSAVVHIEISIDLPSVVQWIKGGMSSDVFQDEPTFSDDFADRNAVLNYQVDVLPHPDGNSGIYYHRNLNKFSNYASGIQYLNSIKGFKDEEFNNQFFAVNWYVHQRGYLCVSLLGEETQLLFAAPTNDVFNIQIGKYPDRSSLGDRLNNKERMKTTTIKVPLSDESDDTMNIAYALLGMSGKGVGFQNNFCQVKAYPSPDELEY